MIKYDKTTTNTVTDYGRLQMQSTTVNSPWKNLRTKTKSFFEKSKKTCKGKVWSQSYMEEQNVLVSSQLCVYS